MCKTYRSGYYPANAAFTFVSLKKFKPPRMKLKLLFSSVLIALSSSSFAQTWSVDSVAMGVGYANDVYYELKQGSTKYQAGNDWHLAFQMSAFPEPNFNAAIRASQAKKGMEVYVISKSVTPTIFANISAADTVGKTAPSMGLSNVDTSWGTGAFFQNRNPADPFSYGWGEYNMTTHLLNGTTVYLIKSGGNAYKFWVQQYVSTPADSIKYTFRIAKLDGSDDRTIDLYRKGTNAVFADRLFAYYNIDSNTIINREPSSPTWDMVFTQFRQLVMGPGGIVQPYTVTGVLTNQGVEVADVRNMDVNEPAHLNDYKSYARTTMIDEIGSDWKTYMNPGPSGFYKMADSTSYFVKTKSDNAYYQVQFNRFDGGGAAAQGKIVFSKRYLGSALSVNKIASASVTNWIVSPNPANHTASVMIDAKAANPAARMIVMDMAGRTMANMPIAIAAGMNGYNLNTANWPAGIYAVQVAGGDWKLSTRLVVAH